MQQIEDVLGAMKADRSFRGDQTARLLEDLGRSATEPVPDRLRYGMAEGLIQMLDKGERAAYIGYVLHGAGLLEDYETIMQAALDRLPPLSQPAAPTETETFSAPEKLPAPVPVITTIPHPWIPYPLAA
jgi:hypothetical protein